MSSGDRCHLPARAKLFGERTDPGWFVLMVSPHAEVAVSAQVERLGAEACWFPTEVAWRVHPGRRRKVKYLRRIAPGYVFMLTDRKVAWHRLSDATSGRVRGVVGRNGVPRPVCEADMARMRCVPKQLEAAAKAAAEAERVSSPCMAEFRDGPLAGLVVDVSDVSSGIATLFSPLLGGAPVQAEAGSLRKLAS